MLEATMARRPLDAYTEFYFKTLRLHPTRNAGRRRAILFPTRRALGCAAATTSAPIDANHQNIVTTQNMMIICF